MMSHIRASQVSKLPAFEIPASKNYVYFLLSQGVVVYVGKTTNINQRILSHISKGEKSFDDVRFIVCASPVEAEQREVANIIHHDPVYNGPMLDLRLTGLRAMEGMVKQLDKKPRRKPLREKIKLIGNPDDWVEFRGALYCTPEIFEQAVKGGAFK